MPYWEITLETNGIILNQLISGRAPGAPGSSLYGSDEHTYCSAVMRAKLLRFIFGGSRPDSGSKVFSTRGIIVNKTFAILISLHLFCFFIRKCKAGNWWSSCETVSAGFPNVQIRVARTSTRTVSLVTSCQNCKKNGPELDETRNSVCTFLYCKRGIKHEKCLVKIY